MIARRVNFARTAVEVRCSGCKRSIAVGDRCVTIISFPEEIFSVTKEGKREAVPPYYRLGWHGIRPIVTRAANHSPLIAWRLSNSRFQFNVDPIVKYYHPKGCGVT